MKRRSVVYPWRYQGLPSAPAKRKAKRSLRRLERRMAKEEIRMDENKIHFLDLPADWFPIEIFWTDIDTGELVREHYMEGPAALTDGGFGEGRNLRMVIKFSDGEVITTDIPARKE